MSDVLVIGAGVAGLGTALALSQQGHEVTVVERDGVELPGSPDEAFEQWQRRGAPQVRHSHAFLARLRNLLRDEAPEVLAELLEAGASELRFTEHTPPTLPRLQPEPGDDDLVALACRRTTFEWVLRRHVAARPGVTLVAGAVTGLVAGGPPTEAVPRVVGAELAGGDRLLADVVVDACGRRSLLPAWLAAIGAGPVEETEEGTGTVYSSRFYRRLPGSTAPALDRLVVGDLGYIKYAVFAGDNGTFSITFGVRSGDAELRRLLHPGPFTAAALTLAGTRPWLQPGCSEPITGVEVMGGLVNRLRRFSSDGLPVATGTFAVGDSSVCTNPVYGRGCALALVQAYLLAGTLAQHGDDPVAAATAYEQGTGREVEPWYRASVAQDLSDRTEAEAEAAGGGPSMGMGAILRRGLLPAARTDPVVYRAFIRSFNLLDPPGTMMQDPDVVARVMAVLQGPSDQPPEAQDLGPSREELLRTVGVPS